MNCGRYIVPRSFGKTVFVLNQELAWSNSSQSDVLCMVILDDSGVLIEI